MSFSHNNKPCGNPVHTGTSIMRWCTYARACGGLYKVIGRNVTRPKNFDNTAKLKIFIEAFRLSVFYIEYCNGLKVSKSVYFSVYKIVCVRACVCVSACVYVSVCLYHLMTVSHKF